MLASESMMFLCCFRMMVSRLVSSPRRRGPIRRVRAAASDAMPLRSLPPCGGATGRGVGSWLSQPLTPPPQPSPTRGEGVRRASGPSAVHPDSMLCAIGVLLLAVSAGLGPAAAQAPPPSDTIKAMVGAWELSNADRDKTCTVNFKIAPAGANYAAELEKKCGDAFPATRGIVGWTIGPHAMLLLLDAAGKPGLGLLGVPGGQSEGRTSHE